MSRFPWPWWMVGLDRAAASIAVRAASAPAPSATPTPGGTAAAAGSGLILISEPAERRPLAAALAAVRSALFRTVGMALPAPSSTTVRRLLVRISMRSLPLRYSIRHLRAH